MSIREYPSYLLGEPIRTGYTLDVHNPWDGSLVGKVHHIAPSHLDQLMRGHCEGGTPLSRSERYDLLHRAQHLLEERREEFSALIRAESGLARQDTEHEVGRAIDVLELGAAETRNDDGQVFSCDITARGKARKIFTVREPLRLALAISPFNHPLNQVVHKVVPAIAAGTPVIVKPSEKTPLTAMLFTELLYEAGVPKWMLSTVLGPIDGVVEPMIKREEIELVTFTGNTVVGKRIARMAGYKKVVLELGGNSPFIIMPDADMDEAVSKAAEGCYRNSGQRCTAIKRLLVHEAIKEEFTARFVEKTKEYVCGDPNDPATRVGTVIDENAAQRLENVVQDAVSKGARVLWGGERQGALMPPTVIADVPPTCEMVQVESFGPLAPIMGFRDLDEAIALANSTPYGLSCGVMTNDLNAALAVVRGVRTGAVNVNEIPGFRIEKSPFGGVKDSGNGIKEGVIEAMKAMSNVKTFSLPW